MDLAQLDRAEFVDSKRKEVWMRVARRVVRGRRRGRETGVGM